MSRPSKTRARPASRRRPGRPRADDDANQRERLLDAAVACFAAQGIAATSLRSIAVAAGVTPALVHYYFGSKERLLDAFVGERIAPVIAHVGEQVRAAGEDPLALVRAFVHGIHAAVEHDPWWPSLWVREVLSETGALRAVLLDLMSPNVAQVLAKAFAAAQGRGRLAPGLDPRLLVVSLVGLTMFPLAAEPIWRRVFPAGDIDRDALRAHTFALLDHGLGATDEST